MSALSKDIWSLVRGSAEAGRVVPPRGISAWLIIAASAAMTFLAVIALAFSLTANRVADGWVEELASSLTIRISAPPDQVKLQTEATLQVLRTTPGIVAARPIENEEQAALLEPWLGTGIDIEQLFLPTLIAVEETPEGPDRDGLSLRLKAEAPGAEIDDHGRWREPMIKAAQKVRNVGFVTLLLVFGVLVSVVVLAVQVAVVSNAQNISTLRLIGARDTFIVRAFVRRITLRALLGALIGCLTALILLQFYGGSDQVISLELTGSEWLVAIAFIPIVGILTFIVTRIAAFMSLNKLT